MTTKTVETTADQFIDALDSLDHHDEEQDTLYWQLLAYRWFRDSGDSRWSWDDATFLCNQ